MGSVIIWSIAIVTGMFLVGVTWAANSRVAGERGWVYNRYNPRRRGMGTLGLLETIYQPAMEHVIDERSSERARGDQDETGDDRHGEWPGAESPG